MIMDSDYNSVHKQTLDAVWNSSADAMRITDLEGKVVDVNAAYCKMTGFEKKQLLEKPFFIIYIKELHKQLYDEFKLRISDGTILSRADKKVTFRNGSERFLEQSNSYIVLPDRKYILSIFRDITEFMEAVDEIKKNKVKYENLYRMIRLMCDNVPDMIWAKDLNNNYLFTNKAICANLLNAKNTDEPIGKNDMFFAKRERERNKNNSEWHTFGEICINSDESVLKSIKNGRFEEYGNVKGKFLFLDVHKSPFYDDKGNLIGTVGSGRDVTKEKQLELEQKKAEEKLKNSELTYRSIIDSVTEAIYVQDENGVFLDVNTAVEKMYGYDRNYFIGKTPEFLSATGKNDLEMVSKAIKSVFKGNRESFEFWGLKKDGTVFPKEVSLAPGLYFGKKVVIAVARDITERKKAEESELSLKNQLRAVLDTVPSYIFAKDYNGKFLMVNKALADLFGVSPEEVIGKSDKDYGATQEQIDWYVNADRKVIDSGNPLLIKEEQVLRKDGSLGWFQTNKVPYKHPGVDKPAILGVAVDITERKKAEDALKESEERLRLALKASNQGWFDLNVKTGDVKVSKEYIEFLGYKQNEYEPGFNKWIENIHPEDKEDVIKKFNYAVETGKVISSEYRRRSKSGEWLWIRSIGELFEYDKDNKPLRMIGTHTDITEIKKKEEEIIMLAFALRSINECVSITDTNNIIIFVNKAFLDTYGYNKREIIGKHVKILGSKRNPEKIHEVILENSIENEWQGEIINTRKDGTEFPVHLSSTAVKDHKGNLVAVIGIATDITERKVAEQTLKAAKNRAEELNRLKSYFLANMSHELRTPLHGILGFSTIIQEKNDIEEIKKIAGIINKSGSRLMNTLNQILDISSLEAKTRKVNYKFVDVNELIANSLEKYIEETKKKKISLTFIPDELICITYTDPEIIKNAVDNLVNNSIKFTHKGSICVKTKQGKFKEKDSIIINVIDTGIGIKEENLKRIFEDFRQESEGLGRTYEGSGLGLALSKRYMDLIGGSIEVISKPGVGSDFQLNIPKVDLEVYKKIKSD